MRALTILCGACALFLSAPARAEGFLSVCDDLPLPPGLTEVADSGLSFDSPGGRIVEAYARGPASAAEVLRFYAGTLPQLGWTRESNTRFRRDTEILHLEPSSDGPTLVLHYVISPE